MRAADASAKAPLSPAVPSSQAHFVLVGSAAKPARPCGFYHDLSQFETTCETMEVTVNEGIRMSMTPAQARDLGRVIARARVRKGLSVRDLAAKAGVDKTWLSRIEQGRRESPAPDRLTRVAEILEIEPERIDRLTKGALNAALPGVQVYFRAKYGLTPEETAQIERYVKRYIGKGEA